MFLLEEQWSVDLVYHQVRSIVEIRGVHIVCILNPILTANHIVVIAVGQHVARIAQLVGNGQVAVVGIHRDTEESVVHGIQRRGFVFHVVGRFATDVD